MESTLPQLPAVHRLAQHPQLAAAIQRHGREAVVQAIRHVLAEVRAALLLRTSLTPPAESQLLEAVETLLRAQPRLFRPVLNATGVLLHTNLGRAPLPAAAWQAMVAAGGYCDLELDLASGARASRLRDVSGPLEELTGAEAGMVVNNNAAAVLLVVAALAGKHPTGISRGHLVEIGGGFRLPSILSASGSPLLEVGTTNRTHLADYEEAIGRGARLLLLVHRSNFVMKGYVSEAEAEHVVALATHHQVATALDLGSGCLLDTTRWDLPAEPTVRQAVAQGFDAVCFSGDKLLGGCQAGFIVGKAAIIDRLREHPLARALRCDKLQLAGAMATLELYRRGTAPQDIPIWRMLTTPPAELSARASAWQAELGRGEVVAAPGAVGGGCMPETDLPGFALALDGDAASLQQRLRGGLQAVMTQIDHGRLLLHPRTVPPLDDAALLAAVTAALQE